MNSNIGTHFAYTRLAPDLGQKTRSVDKKIIQAFIIASFIVLSLCLLRVLSLWCLFNSTFCDKNVLGCVHNREGRWWRGDVAAVGSAPIKLRSFRKVANIYRHEGTNIRQRKLTSSKRKTPNSQALGQQTVL